MRATRSFVLRLFIPLVLACSVNNVQSSSKLWHQRLRCPVLIRGGDDIQQPFRPGFWELCLGNSLEKSDFQSLIRILFFSSFLQMTRAASSPRAASPAAPRPPSSTATSGRAACARGAAPTPRTGPPPPWTRGTSASRVRSTSRARWSRSW